MDIGIEQLRAMDKDYKRRFSEKWHEVYGTIFIQETVRLERWAQRPTHAVMDRIEDYQHKIKHIKSLIENE